MLLSCSCYVWWSYIVGCGEQLTKTMLARECADCVKRQQDTTSALLNCFKHKFLGNFVFANSLIACKYHIAVVINLRTLSFYTQTHSPTLVCISQITCISRSMLKDLEGNVWLCLRVMLSCQSQQSTTARAALIINAVTVIRRFYFDIITRLFSYRPVYQARASITARGVAEGSY